MVLTDSQYHACQAVTWAKGIAMGDSIDSNNPFAWDKVVLNLPGTEGYDCHRPWVFNQSFDGFWVEDLFIYVDDGRPIGPTKDVRWEVSKSWGSLCSWLGIQDASRKVQPSLSVGNGTRPWPRIL